MRTVAITGGTSWLGQALTGRLLSDERLRLALTYLRPVEADRFEDRFGTYHPRIILRRVDVTDSPAVEGFLAEVEARWGAISGLACIAGSWAGGTAVEQTSDLRLERMLDSNLRSTFTMVRAALPYLRSAEWARVMLTASRAAFDTPRDQAAFNIAKAGVVALGRSLAAELVKTNVSVTVLVPSIIDTPVSREAMPDSDHSLWPTPDEVARVAEFLLSREAGVMNGAEVPV
ncbi:MAG: SDR family oxidoreductase [bacterium]|nr:SDR family oxidoreductase [bacterium]MDE0601284.1 SDR family oxidoreductase [bacterium]